MQDAQDVSKLGSGSTIDDGRRMVLPNVSPPTTHHSRLLKLQGSTVDAQNSLFVLVRGHHRCCIS
jgi:hypothetical protein